MAQLSKAKVLAARLHACVYALKRDKNIEQPDAGCHSPGHENPPASSLGLLPEALKSFEHSILFSSVPVPAPRLTKPPIFFPFHSFASLTFSNLRNMNRSNRRRLFFCFFEFKYKKQS